MTYAIETIPLVRGPKCRRLNPISATMRDLLVGQSFVVPRNDPAWHGRLVSNENTRRKGHFYVEVEAAGFRICRDE